MPLAEIVTIEVGAAIAKSILKFWLKDSTIGDDISSSLIDLLKSRTSDALAQRRGQRQFDIIGEKVGESLLPLFESEGAVLDEGGRTAVAQAVVETFNKSKLSSDVLTKRNLEPTQLAQHVLAAYPSATRDFNSWETALYERIIGEACTYIVNIASQLPAFTERSFAEVLQREDRIIAKTQEILKELRQMRERLDPLVEAERFEIDYREAVARNLDELRLVGADVSLPNRRHRLSVAYITLSVEQKPLPRPSLVGEALVKDERAKDIVSVDTALVRSRRLLIRGQAGSGKTTLLQWIAVKVATKSFEGQLSDWNGCLPFYIRLRHCVQSGLPRPEAFPGFVAPAIADTMPKGWVHNVLRSGRAIVLVDGVDEVPASQRADVYTWLKDLAETYKEVRFIITSRPHAIEEGWMDVKAFNDAELQAMELSDIYLFIDHWHGAVREELHIDQEKAELGPLAEHLKDQVRRNHSVRTLATNPLLCAMLCALNRDRRQQLPVNRIELYKACCSLLLERRDKESHIDLTDYPVLNYSQKHRLLEGLAYAMIKENLSEVAASFVDESFTGKLANMPNVPQDISGTAVRQLLVERAGIIREPVAGQIDFTHRTFQEFFAAQAALDAMDIDTLVANSWNDQWREVIILAAGLASKAVCEQLVNGLIIRGDKEKKQRRYQLHLLAISCLETAIELGSEVTVEVEKRLSEVVPPKNMDDAKALAAAGELAVKYLAKKETPSATTTAACVRALTTIASEAALEMLEGYTNDGREAVIKELLKGWDAFDRKTYARRVLSQTFQNKSDLLLERLLSVDGIQYLTNLTRLDLSGCSQLSDFTPLAGLTGLTSLNLSGCSQLSDLTPLAGLIGLTSLNLSGCSQLSDLTLLTSLISLTWLNLYHCSQLSAINLTGLTLLALLDLSGCSHLSDLRLTGLIRLTWLDLSDCSQLSAINLTDLIGLTWLDLSSCSHLSTISLIGLSHLASLDLSGCSQLSDLSLTELTSLTRLNLSGCSHLSNLGALTNLNSLEELILSKDADKLTIPPSIRAKVRNL